MQKRLHIIHAKWDAPYVFESVGRRVNSLYREIDENDKADIIVSAANILENKRLTGEADMSKKDVSLSLANACVAIGFTEDRSVDALDKAVEKSAGKRYNRRYDEDSGIQRYGYGLC